MSYCKVDLSKGLVNDLLLYASKLPTEEYSLCMRAINRIRSLERENLILRLKMKEES